MDQWYNGPMDQWSNGPIDIRYPLVRLVMSIALILFNFKELKVILLTFVALMD